MAGIPHAFVIGVDKTIHYSGHPADPKFEEKLKEAVETSKPQVCVSLSF